MHNNRVNLRWCGYCKFLVWRYNYIERAPPYDGAHSDFLHLVTFFHFPVTIHFLWFFFLCKILQDLLLRKQNNHWFYQTLDFFLRFRFCVGNISVKHSDEAQWHCICFASQPDLLNFKKGWMSKLDESGEVRHSEVECLALLWSLLSLHLHSPLPSFLMRKVVCKAIVADYSRRYHSNSFVAWGTTGVSSLWMIRLSEWASGFTHHLLFKMGPSCVTVVL